MGKGPVSPVDELVFLLAVGVKMVLDELLAELGVALLLSRHLRGVAAQSVQVLDREKVLRTRRGILGSDGMTQSDCSLNACLMLLK